MSFQHKGERRAFTLIELLVVIAIIAILAAILFPVFAQAKAAAKSTASLSNIKQIDLAEIMYQNDYEDNFTLEVVWNSPDHMFVEGNTGVGFSPWTYELLPYEKNGQISQDPQISPNPNSSPAPEAIWDSYNPEYSFNYTQLSPWVYDPNTPLAQQGVVYVLHSTNSSQVSRPASVVVASASSASAEQQWQYWYGVGSPLPWASIEPPYCNGQYVYDQSGFCMDGWGKDGYTSLSLLNNGAAGAYTGNLSIRRSNNTVTSFVDGHAKAVQPGQLATGTDWNATTSEAGNVQVTNASSYIWTNN